MQGDQLQGKGPEHGKHVRLRYLGSDVQKIIIQKSVNDSGFTNVQWCCP